MGRLKDAPAWARVLLGLNMTWASVWLLDDVLFARTIEFVWVEPKARGEAVSEEAMARRLAGTRAMRLVVRGRITPIRFSELDNHFSISLTRGGYAIGMEYDLSNGASDYAAYLADCRVIWEPDRVRFVEPRGYELVFPAAEFHLMD